MREPNYPTLFMCVHYILLEWLEEPPKYCLIVMNNQIVIFTGINPFFIA